MLLQSNGMIGIFRKENKKDYIEYIVEVNKELKARKKILTGEQKSKLRMIQKLTKKAINESEKQTNYYKLNPKMRNFAPKKISN